MMIEFLATIGAAMLIFIAAVVITIANFYFARFVEKKKREYKIKHRFDKPPKAKCYCIDCVSWNRNSSRCDNFDRYMADNWFCCQAEPRKKVE